jgi:hypothetical protein
MKKLILAWLLSVLFVGSTFAQANEDYIGEATGEEIDRVAFGNLPIGVAYTNKVLVPDNSKNLTGLNRLTLTNELVISGTGAARLSGRVLQVTNVVYGDTNAIFLGKSPNQVVVFNIVSNRADISTPNTILNKDGVYSETGFVVTAPGSSFSTNTAYLLNNALYLPDVISVDQFGLYIGNTNSQDRFYVITTGTNAGGVFATSLNNTRTWTSDSLAVDVDPDTGDWNFFVNSNGVLIGKNDPPQTGHGTYIGMNAPFVGTIFANDLILRNTLFVSNITASGLMWFNGDTVANGDMFFSKNILFYDPEAPAGQNSRAFLGTVNGTNYFDINGVIVANDINSSGNAYVAGNLTVGGGITIGGSGGRITAGVIGTIDNQVTPQPESVASRAAGNWLSQVHNSKGVIAVRRVSSPSGSVAGRLFRVIYDRNLVDSPWPNIFVSAASYPPKLISHGQAPGVSRVNEQGNSDPAGYPYFDIFIEGDNFGPSGSINVPNINFMAF